MTWLMKYHVCGYHYHTHDSFPAFYKIDTFLNYNFKTQRAYRKRQKKQQLHDGFFLPFLKNWKKEEEQMFYDL